MLKRFVLVALLLAATACVGERPKTESPGLQPFRGVALDPVQSGLVDGCVQTADPRHASPPEKIRDYCTCFVMNRRSMLGADSDPITGRDTSQVFTARQDACRCAAGLPPQALRSCADAH